MQGPWVEKFRVALLCKKTELEQRLARVNENRRRPLAANSKERAVQLENHDVVDALGNDARFELKLVSAALARIEALEYGVCQECRAPIRIERLLAYPHAEKCIDCALLDDTGNSYQANR